MIDNQCLHSVDAAANNVCQILFGIQCSLCERNLLSVCLILFMKLYSVDASKVLSGGLMMFVCKGVFLPYIFIIFDIKDFFSDSMLKSTLQNLYVCNYIYTRVHACACKISVIFQGFSQLNCNEEGNFITFIKKYFIQI